MRKLNRHTVWIFIGLGVTLAGVTSCTNDSKPNTPIDVHKRSDEAKQVDLKILNWNVLYGFNHGNSIEAGTKWIVDQSPDVVALQELNGNTSESLQELASRWGHDHSAILKEDGFPVGLTSNQPIELIERRVDGFHHGYLHCKTHDIHFFVVHFWPNKDHEALAIVEKIKPLLADGGRVIVLGDFNTHSQKDQAYLSTKANVNPLYEVVNLFESIGMVDLVHKHDPDAKYSCPSPITIPKWSADMDEVNSKRQRIDFVFGDSNIAQYSTSGQIVLTKELEQISDHYPVLVEFQMPEERE